MEYRYEETYKHYLKLGIVVMIGVFICSFFLLYGCTYEPTGPTQTQICGDSNELTGDDNDAQDFDGDSSDGNQVDSLGTTSGS